MTVTSSSYTTHPQADGRVRVTEKHVLADGSHVSFEYLADLSEIDPAVVMTARAERVAAEIAVRNASLALAQHGSIPWTKVEWERKFTDAEFSAVWAFNDTFESAPYLTDEQKTTIRRGLAEYKLASVVDSADPRTQAMIGLYVALGVLTAERGAEILNG